MIDEKTMVSFITNIVKIIVIVAICNRLKSEAGKKIIVMPTINVMKAFFWAEKLNVMPLIRPSWGDFSPKINKHHMTFIRDSRVLGLDTFLPTPWFWSISLLCPDMRPLLCCRLLQAYSVVVQRPYSVVASALSYIFCHLRAKQRCSYNK